MKNRIVALVVLAALAVPWAGRAETVAATIGRSDRVYTFVADTSQSARAVAMWQKRNTDLDLFVFFLDDEEPILLVSSFATGERLEITEYGILPGAAYSVVVSKFEGPSSKFTLNVSSAGSELVSFSGSSDPYDGQLRFTGELPSLATQDPYFAQMERLVQDARQVKARYR